VLISVICGQKYLYLINSVEIVLNGICGQKYLYLINSVEIVLKI